ncbi:MAG: acyltransferase [Desulfobacterales bacterium]
MPYHLRGILTLLVYICFTFVIFVFFVFITIFKLLVPHPTAKALAVRAMDVLSSRCWVFCANLTHRIFGKFTWDIHWPGNDAAFKTDRWSVILLNHQSWVDILVLIKVFYKKIPPYKFFIKKQLLWMPLMGPCFWALDYPIMKRYSREFLEKNPHLKGTDLEATRAACEKYKHLPVSVINFPEGTRFTPEKHQKKASRYRHLLNPKAGGTSLVLFAMGDVLENIFDVTIVYPESIPGLWGFFCGRPRHIIVDIRQMKMDPSLSGNYATDAAYKAHFQKWLNRLWEEKDQVIDRRKTEYAAGTHRNTEGPGKY